MCLGKFYNPEILGHGDVNLWIEKKINPIKNTVITTQAKTKKFKFS